MFIGATAAGLLDMRPTSMSTFLPGYVIHATALDNILHGDALRRPGWLWRTALLLLLGTLAGAVLGAIPSLRDSTLAALGLFILYVGAALLVFSTFQVWMLLMPPAVVDADSGEGRHVAPSGAHAARPRSPGNFRVRDAPPGARQRRRHVAPAHPRPLGDRPAG